MLVKKLLVILTFLVFSHSSFSQLNLSIGNLLPVKSTLRVAIFDSESSFLTSNILRGFEILVEKDTVIRLIIDDLAEGYYAISAYQDINDNGKLDKKLFGQPSEPYGFSGSKQNSFRPPSFIESKFKYPEIYIQKIYLIRP
jgi:uncharacterized protein (DUF2141 family)